MNNIATVLDNELEKLVNISSKTTDYRVKLLEKLLPTVLKIKIDPDKEEADSIKAKTDLIKTCYKLVDDYESNPRQNINTYQRQIEVNNSDRIDKELLGNVVKALLDATKNTKTKNTDNGSVTIDRHIDNELQEVMNKKNITITQDELKDSKDIDINKVINNE